MKLAQRRPFPGASRAPDAPRSPLLQVLPPRLTARQAAPRRHSWTLSRSVYAPFARASRVGIEQFVVRKEAAYCARRAEGRAGRGSASQPTCAKKTRSSFIAGALLRRPSLTSPRRARRWLWPTTQPEGSLPKMNGMNTDGLPTAMVCICVTDVPNLVGARRFSRCRILSPRHPGERVCRFTRKPSSKPNRPVIPAKAGISPASDASSAGRSRFSPG